MSQPLMSTNERVGAETLRRLQPIGQLTESRLGELAALCFVERVGKTLDPFRIQGIAGTAVYLLQGQLLLSQSDGASVVLVGGSPEATHPIGRKTPFVSAKAITDVELIRVDDELLDIMVTFDQLVATDVDEVRDKAQRDAAGDWRLLTGMFSVNNLRSGALSRLPAAHLGVLLGKFERVEAKRGAAVVTEGGVGDFYFVLENGRAQVTRRVGGVDMRVAQLRAGDAFGEEALLAETPRNATVTMLTDGTLLRLSKQDFNELLKKPLLAELAPAAARERVQQGAQWVDVRYPSEYQYEKLPGALNIPLAEIRNAAGILDKAREYVLYCQTGRRSAAAAFLLAQRGFKASVLHGGLAALGDRSAQ